MSQEPTGETASKWIVVIGVGSWSRCYGLFDSYEAVMAWVRANQLEDAQPYPVNGYDAN